MTNFNSDLNNLFKNYQQQQLYKQKAFDVNKDGKINAKDKTQLTNTEKNLLKITKLFDFNNDGKLNQSDVDLFLKGDINQDGKVSQDELNFVSAYKKELTTAFTKQKADFVIDGKKYVKGKLASGVVDGKFYKSGVLADGTANGKQYVKGVLANGIYKNVLYKNGEKFTGTYTDNKYYKNGKVFTGTINGANYKAGVLQYSIVDNNGKGYPNAQGSAIRFQNGKKYVDVKLAVGEKAVINKDGTVNVTLKDGKTVKKYDKTGNLIPSSRLMSIKISDKISIEDENLVYTYNNKKYVFTPKPDYINTKEITSYVGTEWQSGIIKMKDGKEYVFNMTSDSDKEARFNTGSVAIIDNKEMTKTIGNKTISFKEEYQYLSDKTKTYIKYVQNAELSDRIKSDIKIVKAAEEKASKAGAKGTKAYQDAYNASIKAQMISTPSNMKNVVGEVVEKSDGLYVNDGSKLVKLNISAETYLKLFPPVERYDLNQKPGNIGNCYFVTGCLTDMMKNPKTFSQILQMFSENSKGDISVTFLGSYKKYGAATFSKGQLKEIDGHIKGEKTEKDYVQSNGSLGTNMLEQAFAILKSTKGKDVDNVDMDKAFQSIWGGNSEDVYKQVLNMSGTNDSVRKSELESYFKNIADDINAGNVLLTFSSRCEKGLMGQYGLISPHAFSIEKIDIEKGLVYIINPYSTCCSTTLTFEEFELAAGNDSSISFHIGKFK